MQLSENISDTYRTVGKFTFNFLVLILIDLQEVVHLNAKKKKWTNQFSHWCQTKPVLCFFHCYEISVGAKFSFWFLGGKKKI